VLVINSIDETLRLQEVASVSVRQSSVLYVVEDLARTSAGSDLVVSRTGRINPKVRNRFLLQDAALQKIANEIARADVQIRFGIWNEAKQKFNPSSDGEFLISSAAIEPHSDEARTSLQSEPTRVIFSGGPQSSAIEVTLIDPLSTRAARLREVGGVIGLASALAMLLSVFFAAFLSQRFARPVADLSSAAAAIGNGDLSARVSAAPDAAINDEMSMLLEQFNVMAERLETSVLALRKERDSGQAHLADISHELRTPMAALRAFVDLLANEQATDAPTRKRLLVEAGRQLERMDALTANILELSRFDAGISQPRLESGDLRVCVRTAIDQAAAGARRRGVALNEELPSRSVLVRHDPTLVGQAIANLVANALKFTPRGGTVTVVMQPLATGAARIVVRDDGVGISPEELPRIFDRFYRGTEGLAAAGRSARATGSGLGLAIVKSIVDMHAGRIVVESLAGKGTSFALTFPADPELAQGEPAEPEPPSASSSLISVGRRAAALLGEVAKSSLRIRRVLRAVTASYE
jgi:signal transduction histidine kinase